MAKIGTLSYDINGNDNLKKILQDDKTAALELKKVLEGMGINKISSNSSGVSKEIERASLAQVKLTNAMNQSAASSLISEQKIEQAIKGTEKANNDLSASAKRVAQAEASVATEVQRQAAIKAKAAAQVSAISAKSASQELLAQQKLQTEIARTESAQKRAANVGVQGHNSVNKSAGLVNKTIFSQNNLLNQVSQAAGIYFSIYQVGSFVKSLYQVSGEFEKQKVSLAAILQNTDQAGVLFERIKSLAVKSPFQFSELVSYTKQLSAFSVPYNELYDTTKRLADVSAGLGVDMSRLVLAYGQVRSASVLRGQELRQFTEAGIPMVDELAKKFTKLTGEATSAGDVFDKISRRQVPFEMVKEIFTELTSEGGKFYMMQEQQAETLSGKLSNLKDSYQLMLNSIGEGNSGIMKDSVNILTSLMNHWEDVARVLKTVVVAYGTYKAVLLITNNLAKIQGAIGLAQALYQTARACGVATAAQALFNTTALANPYVAIATALAALVGGIVLFSGETKTAAETQSDLYKAMIAQQEAIEQQNASVKELIKTATDLNKNTVERQKALNTLNGIMPSVFKNLSLERIAVLGVAGAYNEYNHEMEKSVRIGTKTNYIMAQQELVKAQQAYDEIVALSKSSDNVAIYDTNAKNRLDSAKKAVEFYKKQSIEQDQLYNTQKKFNKEQSGWREEVNKLRQSIKETDIAWGEQEGFSEYAKKIREGYNTASTALKEFSKTNKFSSKEYASNKQQMDDYAKVAAKLGINLKEAKKTHVAGAVSDPIYTNIKRQIDIIDKAKTAYDSYLKFVGEGRAAELVKRDTGIDFSKESATQKLEKLSTKGMLPKNVESTKARIAEITVKYDKKSTLDSLKEALDATIKFVNDNKDRYNLYNELFDITGNKDLAKQLSFGSLDGTIGAYSDYIRSEFDKLLTKQGYEGISFDKLIGMSDEDITKTIGKNDALMSMFANVKQAINEQKVTTVKSMAQIISDSKTIEQRVSAINAKYDEQIILAKESGQTQEFINQAEAGFNEARKKEIDEIMSSMFQLSPFYRELFGELSDISYWHLKSIKDNAVKIMDEIANSKDASGKLTYGSYNKDTGKLEGYSYEFKDESGKIQKVTISLAEYARMLKQVNKVSLEMKSQNPFGELTKSLKDYKKEDGSKAGTMDIIASKAAAFKSVTSELGGATSELFSAFGNDKAADAVGFATDLAGSASDIATGIASGNPVQVVTAVIKGITTIAQYHDKKLQRAIENSKREVQKLQSAYESLAKVIERQLGAATESQLKSQIANLKKQQSELYKQRQAEIDKKKTDESAVQDYTDQISEMADKIKYYFEDLFSSEYGNTIKDWASSISSALVDAFANGTDAAQAFDDSVASIIQGLAKKMVQLQFIEPAMENIRTYLFGANGVFNDGSLSTQDVSGLIDQFASLKDRISVAQTAWDAIAAAAAKNGIDIAETSTTNKSGITANIQSLTEDTGNILASYINAIRADLSIVRSILDGSNSQGIYNKMYTIMQAYYPTITNTLALQQAELVKIQNNTLRSADSNDGILNAIEEVRSTLKKATTAGSGTKLNV